MTPPAAHPAAARFPLLGDEELQRLADDIAENGLLHPIVLDMDGLVLDGRNRLAACLVAEVEPTYTTHDGDPVAFVLSANVERRHMTTGQLAMATAMVMIDAGLRENGRWKYGTVESPEFGKSWSNAMSQAATIADHAPELVGKVVGGDLPISKAYDEAKAIKANAEKVAAELAELREAAPDLAEQVDDGHTTVTAAKAEHEKREREAADRRRDSRHLLERIVMLAVPPHTDPEFVQHWADHIDVNHPDDPAPAELVDDLDRAVQILTDLQEALA